MQPWKQDQRLQSGVVARRQVLAGGGSQTELARAVRRGELVTVYPGVYVDHNGPLTWLQRAWAAVLYAWPAALAGDSALHAAEGPGNPSRDQRTIHVVVAHDRRLTAPPGVRVHRSRGFEDRTQWNLSPPRVRYEDAVLDVAAASSDLAAVARLADACGTRRTQAARLLQRLDARPRIANREWLRAVLADVSQGTCSVLEHGYLDLVERPHGLPAGERQALRCGPNGVVYRDVEYADLGPGRVLLVELDGRLFHSSARARDDDLERDLDAAATRDATTLRLGFGQVYGRACTTAGKVAAVLSRLGWDGRPTACVSCELAG